MNDIVQCNLNTIGVNAEDWKTVTRDRTGWRRLNLQPSGSIRDTNTLIAVFVKKSHQRGQVKIPVNKNPTGMTYRET